MIYLVILGSALLEFFSLPNRFLSVGLLGWIALIPFLVIFLKERPPHKALFYAWLLFLFLFSSLFWINPFSQPERFMSVFALVGTVLFFLIIPFLVALAFFFARYITEQVALILKPFAFAATWVSFEYLISVFPVGPTLPAAISQYSYPRLIQSANLFGIYGVSFLVILVNVTLVLSVLNFRQHKREAIIVFSLVLVIFLSNFWYGAWTLKASGEKKEEAAVRMGLVQPSSSLFVNSFMGRSNFLFEVQMSRLIGVSKKLIKERQIDYILWPELAVGRYLAQDERVFSEVKNFIRAGGVPVILGSSFFDWARKKACNVIVGFNGDGEITDIYKKNYLVPLFETNDYVKGNKFEPLRVDGRLRRVGGLICFESVFPRLSREMVRKGASLLVLLSNDVWFGNTNWPYLHAAAIVFRAVETGRYAIHLNNSGPSVAVDDKGRFLLETPAFEMAYGAVQIYPLKKITLYVRYGDWFAGLCMIFTLLIFFNVFRKLGDWGIGDWKLGD